MPSASCCFLHVFYIVEKQYQTEFKCNETLRRFFMDQKEDVGPWLHLGESRGGDNPPGRARVGCAQLGCPRTTSLLYKYPNIPETLGESTKHNSSCRKFENHEIQSNTITDVGERGNFKTFPLITQDLSM